jgi:NAD(P)-dependent dehydrogenase (short-subunit alcohol dehydrogenase family)
MLATVTTVFAASHASAQEAAATPAAQQAVLITGASSGIGLKTTQLLSAAGTFVYAGARKQADMDRLDAMENVEAVRLDVTKQDEIDAAVAQVKAGGRGLHGVVNNAGIALLGPLVEIPESDLELTFNVNVIGPYRITKAFLPLLLESKGRVINMSSVSGIQANMLFGTYSMSKHALEAYNDILALELQPFGIRVIAVEPGAYKSRLAATGVGAMEARGFTIENSLYTKVPWERMKKSMSTGTGPMANWPEPDDVAYAVQDALFAESPKEHYMITSSEHVAEITIKKVIEELVRYNEGQEFSYDRDELIRMLDDELEGARDAAALHRFGPPPLEGKP